MAVDPGYASWLGSDARFVEGTVAGALAKWGDGAIRSRIISPLTDRAVAQAEVNAQAAFLAGPLARDRIVIKGQLRPYLGCIITVRADRLGYENGVDVFVIDVQEGETTSTLLVLKRLA